MSERFYKDVLDHSPIGYAYYRVLCDEDCMPYDYELIDANLAFAKMMGLALGEIVGKKAAEALPSMWGGKSELSLCCEEIAIQGGGSIEFEHYFEPLGRWYKINLFSPAKSHIVTYFTDIAHQMRILEEQITLNTFFNDIVIELDENFRYINYNPSKKYDFQQRQKIIGKTIREVYGLEFATLLESVKQRWRQGKWRVSFTSRRCLVLTGGFAQILFTGLTASIKRNIYLSQEISPKKWKLKGQYIQRRKGCGLHCSRSVTL